MGWLFMTLGSMGEHKTPKTYLDNQFTFTTEATPELPVTTYRVTESACPGNRVYYAAVEHLVESQVIAVSAIICLVKWNPRSTDGHNFGYKDMGEGGGPCECDCPTRILEKLTASNNPVALDWRRRCYERAELNSRPLNDGALIRFAVPIEFTDGAKIETMRVRKSGRTIDLFTLDGRGPYRIRNLLDRVFETVPERKVAPTYMG